MGRDVDFRSDIYSLGVTLYHMVAKRPPFDGTVSTIMRAHIREELPSPRELNPDVPDSLCRIIQKMTGKDPHDRYSTCEMLFEELENSKLKEKAGSGLDMDRGELLWQVANGDGARHHPDLSDLDLPPLGFRGEGFVMLTRTLLFATSSRDDWNPPMMRAFRKTTGEPVWEMELPARTRATPMTYLPEGRQFIVVAVGGGRFGPEQEPDELVALALP